MELTGKINLFVLRNANYTNYVGSISRKEQDGTYKNARIEVRFVGEKFSKDKLDKLKENTCYKVEVSKGFLSFDMWEKDGKVNYKNVIVITDAKILNAKECKAKSSTSAVDIGA